MKATPLQQLILKLADKQDEHSFNTEYDDGVRRGLALAIVNARELLKGTTDQSKEYKNQNKGEGTWFFIGGVFAGILIFTVLRFIL